jgi:phage FluMu protein Com
MTGWMVLEGYLKHMCPTCGQIFQLTNNAEEIDLRFLEKGDHDAHIV